MSDDVLQDGSIETYDSEVTDLSTQLDTYTTATNNTFNGVNLLDSTSNLTVTARESNYHFQSAVT